MRPAARSICACPPARWNNPAAALDAEVQQGIVDGAYWLRPPGPNCDLALAYQGTIATEAIVAASLLAGNRRDIGVLAVTSADRLNAGWQAAQRVQSCGDIRAGAHVETLLKDVPRHAIIVTVIDGHPATLSWLGGVAGHQTAGLGVEHFGQTGTVQELYRHFGINAEAIALTASGLSPGRPLRPILPELSAGSYRG